MRGIVRTDKRTNEREDMNTDTDTLTRSRIVEETTLSVEPRAEDPPEEADEAYVGTMVAHHVIAETLGAVKEYQSGVGSAPPGLDQYPDAGQNYVDALSEAFRAVEEMQGRDDIGEVKQDMSELDDPTLRKLRATVGYVASHFGIEIDFPTASEGG
jgi:hypothetical protein